MNDSLSSILFVKKLIKKKKAEKKSL